MNISIGICAYNEENNIEKLLNKLLNQKLKTVNIKEIIVISSGSIDKTNEIVKKISKKSKKIKLITQDIRYGKASAINEFLKIVKSEILILESADTLPNNETIEKLCNHFINKEVGIVGGHPIPINNKNNFLSFLINFKWLLHHKISIERPKFGEIIAFRNIIKKIPNTAADEEYLAMLIKDKGYKVLYEQNALVYNKGPETISDFLKQRKRAYCGHLSLRKNNNYKAATLSNFYVLKTLLKNFKLKYLFYIILTVFVESYGRLLGYYDFKIGKKHYIWEISKSSK